MFLWNCLNIINILTNKHVAWHICSFQDQNALQQSTSATSGAKSTKHTGLGKIKTSDQEHYRSKSK